MIARRSPLPLVLRALLVCLPIAACAAPEQLASPDGRLRIEFELDGQGPVLRARHDGRVVLETSELGLESSAAAGPYRSASVRREEKRDAWRPLYGEQAVVEDHYNALQVALAPAAAGARPLGIEIRAYDHALALRYRVNAAAGETLEIKQDATAFRFPDDTLAWPIATAEALYPADPVRLSEHTRAIHAPLTLRLPGAYVSLLEADTQDFPRMRLARRADGAVTTRLHGPYRGGGAVRTPWRVLLIGAEAADLIRHQSIVKTLNPPAAGDFSWVRPGKVLSAVGNFPSAQNPRRIETAHLLRLVDWAAEQNFRSLQLDWGWNGTEKPWTDEERAAYRDQVPERYRAGGWEKNTLGALDQIASGYVPFRPNPKTRGVDILVDLDLPRLISHARDRGLGVSLYVNSRWSLPSQDMDRLFALYESWGVAGLKPGFVHYGKQEDSAFILRIVETAARHKLWLNIHDEYLPDGSARTYPHLMSCEAGAGAENKPTLVHDLTLPFARGLAGPFDYTPLLFDADRGNVYSLAYLLAFYNPAPVIRGGYSAWNPPGGRGGPELELLKALPDTWDETRVLAGEIGRHLAVARRSGSRWFIGAVAADAGAELALKLDFLPAGKFRLTRFADGGAASPSATREVSELRAGDTLSLRLPKAGGFAGWIDPLP